MNLQILAGFQIDKERQVVRYSTYCEDDSRIRFTYIPLSFVQEKPVTSEKISQIEKMLGDIRWARLGVIDSDTIVPVGINVNGTVYDFTRTDERFIAHVHGPDGEGSGYDTLWTVISYLVQND